MKERRLATLALLPSGNGASAAMSPQISHASEMAGGLSPLFFFRTQQLPARNWTVAGASDLTRVGESQGEDVAFGGDDAIYVTGEGGDESQPGKFARLQCAR